MLQHRLGSDTGESFAGETGGSEARRDDAQNLTRHRRFCHSAAGTLLFCSLIALPALYAQDTGSADRVSIEPRLKREMIGTAAPRASIRVDSTLVLIPVSVTDPLNRIVTGLEKENFQLFEDNQEQQLLQFAREDAP